MKGKIDKSNNILAMVLLLCLLSSVILSFSILARYFCVLDVELRYISILSYIITLLLLPIMSSLYIVKTTKLKSRRTKAFFLGGVLLLYILIIDITLGWFLTFDLVPEYLFFWMPFPLILVFYAGTNYLGKISKKKIMIASLIITLTILLPNVVAFSGVSILENMANSFSDPTEKASFISTHVIDMTVYEHKFRSNNDYWKFLLTGVGTCGEISMATLKMLNNIGFETRRIEVSGENHAFTEIIIGGEWKVIDGKTVQTREDWLNNRISDVGCVTYLCTITDNSFIELIDDYTNKTDEITLRITQNDEPVVAARVQLKHTFMMENGSKSILQILPSSDRYFVSDSNGLIKLHLGKPFYKNEFAGSELSYWVFVNGQNKTSVTSDGIGAHQPPVEISLGT